MMASNEKQQVENGVTSDAADLDKGPNTVGFSHPENPADDGAKAAEATDREYEWITGVKLWLVLSSLTLVCFLMTLDMSIIVTAIPRITSQFHSLTDVGWYGTAYLFANSAVQPLTGRLYSRFGSKHTFLVFLGIFELGSLLCGVAQSTNMLIIARAVAGLGASGLTNGALTILAASVPMHKRPPLMGIIMAVSQLGIVSGPLIGGALTQYASWRWCFYINLPIGAVCALLLLMIEIPDRLHQPGTKNPTILSTLSQLDPVGFVLFAPFAIMFLMALEWGGTTYAWRSATIIGLFCGAGGIFILFVIWEYHVGEGAMFPYSMMRKTVVWSSCIVICLFFGCLLTLSYYLPIYFQAVKGVSPTLSGVYILPGILSQMLMAIVSGVIVGKSGYYLPWIAASGVISATGTGLLSTFKPDTSTARWIGYQFLAGFGRGCGVTMPIVAIQNILPPEQIPVGMSLASFCQTFGGTVFLTFAQTIFSRSLLNGLKEFAPTVSPEVVITAGATGIRQIVRPEELLGVLEAYNLGIDRNFYLAAGAAAGTFVFCWGMGWYSVKKEAVNLEA